MVFNSNLWEKVQMKAICKLALLCMAVVGMTFSAHYADAAAHDGKKKIVFVAGKRSHGYGQHEHFAGCTMLAKWLNESGLPIEAVVVKDGYPEDTSVFDGADAVVVYADGGGGHPFRPHMDEVDAMAKKGVGIAALHYGVEILKGDDGDKLKEWIGGYFETDYSVNPHWLAKFDDLPDHEIANGVKPFEMQDEWYFNMRFIKGMKGVLPILSDVPPATTMERPDGAHSGNPTVREMVKNKVPQHLAWGVEREDGGRGFGFTGGHFHIGWAHPDFRKVVLNALVWTAGLDVPEDGVPSKAPTVEEMMENQDYPTPDNFDKDRYYKSVGEWNQ